MSRVKCREEEKTPNENALAATWVGKEIKRLMTGLLSGMDGD